MALPWSNKISTYREHDTTRTIELRTPSGILRSLQQFHVVRKGVPLMMSVCVTAYRVIVEPRTFAGLRFLRGSQSEEKKVINYHKSTSVRALIGDHLRKMMHFFPSGIFHRDQHLLPTTQPTVHHFIRARSRDWPCLAYLTALAFFRIV